MSSKPRVIVTIAPTGGMASRQQNPKLPTQPADIARDAQPVNFNGEQGVMVNAPGAFHSLVGDLLSRETGTFALMWQVGSEGQIKAGLRSQRGYDCSVLAVSMGGGGHAQACGFRMAAERLPELLSGTFKA